MSARFRRSSHARIVAVNPFTAAQVQSVIEDLRLLEAFITAPLGLHSDIRMLRQSVPLPAAADLSQEENRHRRIVYRELSDDPARLALETAGHLESSLAVLEASNGAGDRPFSAEWTDRARRVLVRAVQRVAGDLRAETAKRVQGLYVIVDPEATNGWPVLEVAGLALDGGANVIQLRDKAHETADVLSIASELKAVCEDSDALFILNDDPTVALVSEAHGLHVGQSDISVTAARRVLEHGQIVGRSNNSMDEVADSLSLSVDYLAVGAVYPTASLGKSDRPVVGVEMIGRVKQVADQPVVAIGGINIDNVTEVVRAGADCVCVVSAVTMAQDVKAATAALAEAIINAKRSS